MTNASPFQFAALAGAVVALGLVAVSPPAHASSPDAWAAMHADAVRACTAASGLKRARALGDVIDFDDAVGRSAVLVGGVHPQPHMKGRRGRVLCLFDRRTREAKVEEADRLVAPKPR